MPSVCRVVTKLKGFKDFIYIYKVDEKLEPLIKYKNTTILSDIKTHLYNILFYDTRNDEQCELFEPENEDKNLKELEEVSSKIQKMQNIDISLMIDKSVTIFGREIPLKDCFKKIEYAVKNKDELSTYILITGEYGTGKSLFIRCLMKKYLDIFSPNNQKITNISKNIFYSSQFPNTFFETLNGFKTIMIEIYKFLKEKYPSNFLIFFYFKKILI
jgi:hypothetical protein